MLGLFTQMLHRFRFIDLYAYDLYVSATSIFLEQRLPDPFRCLLCRTVRHQKGSLEQAVIKKLGTGEEYKRYEECEGEGGFCKVVVLSSGSGMLSVCGRRRAVPAMEAGSKACAHHTNISFLSCRGACMYKCTLTMYVYPSDSFMILLSIQ